MYLKKLHIKNFRCFSDYEIEFAPRVTVLFGKNGSGKSTLIHAIHKAMSMFMYSEKTKIRDIKTKKMKPIGEKSIRPGNPFVSVEGFSSVGNDLTNKRTKPASYLIEIGAEAFLDADTQLNWAMSAYAINNRLRPSEYKEAFMRLYDWHQNTRELPLLAYYSDGYPHAGSNGNKTKKDKSKEAFHVEANLPEIGYTDWNSEKGFTNTWLQRLNTKLWLISRIPDRIKDLEKQHNDGKVNDDNFNKRLEDYNADLFSSRNEVNAIISCLQQFSQGDAAYEISSLELGRYNRNDIMLVSTSGKETSMSDLPAGYKRMLFIVLDIAYRSYLLSGMKTTDTEGLVIIDEIDLHLHPELEQSVLERFTRTFTKAQFVVSTHSPAVISNLPQDDGHRVLQMIREGDEYCNVKTENIYGLDYNITVADVMDASSRNSHVQTIKDRYVRLKRRNSDKVAIVAKEIERLFPTSFKEVIEELNAKAEE